MVSSHVDGKDEDDRDNAQITPEDRDAIALPDTPTPPGAREVAEALKNNPHPGRDQPRADNGPTARKDVRRYDA